jgi:hypothetical protein
LKTLIKTASACVFVCLFGCASNSQAEDTEINPETFNHFFEDQVRCKTYIEALTRPAVDAFVNKSSIQEMRAWINKNENDRLSVIFLKVKADTFNFGKIDPKSKSDQEIIFASFNKIIQIEPGFNSSGCGSDVQEYVNEALYLGVGGNYSKVSAQLSRNQIQESGDQRWALTALLMAGQIAVK